MSVVVHELPQRSNDAGMVKPMAMGGAVLEMAGDGDGFPVALALPSGSV